MISAINLSQNRNVQINIQNKQHQAAKKSTNVSFNGGKLTGNHWGDFVSSIGGMISGLCCLASVEQNKMDLAGFSVCLCAGFWLLHRWYMSSIKKGSV